VQTSAYLSCFNADGSNLYLIDFECCILVREVAKDRTLMTQYYYKYIIPVLKLNKITSFDINHYHSFDINHYHQIIPVLILILLLINHTLNVCQHQMSVLLHIHHLQTVANKRVCTTCGTCWGSKFRTSSPGTSTFSLLVIFGISRSSSYIKVTGLRSRSQDQQIGSYQCN